MPKKKVPTISNVLSYYNDEVVPALAAALTVDDSFPEEVLNEIRNSMTHLSCANANTAEEKQNEIAAAQAHLQRVVLDSLKVCVLVLATNSEAAIKALTDDIQLPAKTYKRMSELRRRRKELSADEAHRPIINTLEAIEKLKELYADFDEFYGSLDSEFAGDTAEMRRQSRKNKNYKGIAIGFVIGVLSGLASNYVFSIIADPVNVPSPADKILSNSNNDPIRPSSVTPE